MARVGRRFPSHVLVGQRQALAVPAAAPAAPLPKQVIQDAAALARRRQQHHGSVAQNRWSGYQWAGLAAVPPLPRQVVIDAAVASAAHLQDHQRRSVVAAPRPVAAQTFATPTKSIVLGDATAGGTRRAHRGLVTQNRWPGYQWVALPPVTPLTRPVVEDQAGVWQARQGHRRGQVIAPSVQLAAAASGTPAATVTPPRQAVVLARQVQTERRRRGDVIAPLVAPAAASAPPPIIVTPLPRQVVVMRPATPRQARLTRVIQPRVTSPQVTPRATVTIIDVCAAGSQRRHGGHVIVGRPRVAPVTAPRPNLVHTTQPRRQRRGGVSASLVQRFVPTGAPTTLITTPAVGYIAAGDTGTALAGDTGRVTSGAGGASGAGLSGQVRI